MKFSMLLPVFSLPLLISGQDAASYPSLPSRVLSTYEAKAPDEQNARTMAASAQAFLDSLNDERRGEALLPFDSPEKAKWTNVPPRGPQGGVRLGDLNEEQLEKACDLLAAVLSEQGYGKARNIPLADDRLLRNGRRRPGFGAEDYWLAIFGTPSATDPWALQFDGHHLAINLAFHGDSMTMSPTFIGTQPRAFKLGGETIAPMLNKDHAAFALLGSLDDAQKSQAIVGKRRANLVTAAGKDGFVPEKEGVSCQAFDEEQRKTLMSLIELYVGDLPAPVASRRLEELKSEIDDITFAWWGPAVYGGDYSYRLQGPTLIIEYAGQDLGGDPANHLHSMYRNPTNEYGAGFE